MAAPELTNKEQTLLANAWMSAKTTPDIDWEKFARLGGYTNTRSGKNAMATITKKLEAQAAAGGGGEESDSEAPRAKPAGRKRKNTVSEGEGGVFKAAKLGKKKFKEPVEEENDEIEDPAPTTFTDRRLSKTPRTLWVKDSDCA